MLLLSCLPALTLLKFGHFWQFFLIWGWKYDTKMKKIFNQNFSKLQHNFCVCMLQWKLLRKTEHCQQCIKWKNSLFHLYHKFAVHLNANVTVSSFLRYYPALESHQNTQNSCFRKQTFRTVARKSAIAGLSICAGAWHSKIWHKLHWFKVFRFLIWEGLKFCLGALSPLSPPVAKGL